MTYPAHDYPPPGPYDPRGVYYDEHRRGLEEEDHFRDAAKMVPDPSGLWAIVGIVLVAMAIVVAVLVSV